MSKIYVAGENTFINLNSTIFIQLEEDTDWTKVAVGSGFILAIKSNGTLWVIGHNYSGQLGLGDNTNRDNFTQVGTDTNWTDIACGENHSLAIKSNGTLWSTGSNNWGQLGLNDYNNRNSFTQVGFDINWTKVDCGTEFSFALKSDGTLWSCGNNDCGQLGQGGWENTYSFNQAGSDTDWSKIVCGFMYTLALKDDGSLWGAGLNENHQLGTTVEGPEDPYIHNNFIQEDTNSTWIDIACGEVHSLAIKDNSKLYGTGADSYNGVFGLLGGIGNQSNFTQIGSYNDWLNVSCGQVTSFGLRSVGIIYGLGVIYGSGGNDCGQLGLGCTDEVLEFTQIGDYTKWQHAPKIFNEFSVVLLSSSSTVTYGKHRSICGGIRFGNKELIGSALNGKIYQLDPNAYTDAGSTIKRIRRTQIVSADNKFILHKKLQIEFEPGVGLEGEDDPTVILKWSDDGGNTWTEGIELSIGSFGEYNQRVIWRRLGKARQRIYELSTTAPVKLIIIDAFAEIEVTQG